MSKKLLFSVSISDCRVEYLASRGGKGGQHKNRRHTTVRITHPPSGATAISSDERDQLQNKRLAWSRLVNSKEFKTWHRLTVAELLSGKSVDDLVEEAMDPSNLKIEVRTPTGWQTTSATDRWCESRNAICPMVPQCHDLCDLTNHNGQL